VQVEVRRQRAAVFGSRRREQDEGHEGRRPRRFLDHEGANKTKITKARTRRRSRSAKITKGEGHEGSGA